MTSPGPGNAVELAVAYVSIVPETSKIARGVREALREAQRIADRTPIDIKASIDRTRIARDITAVRSTLRDLNIRVNADTASIPRQIQRSMREIGRNFDFTIPVDVVPDFARFPARMDRGLREIERNFSWSINVGVDLDSVGAVRDMSRLQALLQAMAHPITQDVNVEADRDGRSALSSLGSSLGGLSKAAAGAAAVGAGIAAIGGAAGGAAGAVGALGAGLVALGPAAAASIATIAVGVSGIGDAFKALSAAEQAAGKDGAAQAKAVAAANDQLEAALEGVTSAQRTQADAVKDAEDAHKDIARAYKDAADELEDYNLKLRDAALSEQEAALAVREAQQELAKAKPEDREKALLRLQRAELRYAEAAERNRDVQEEANDAQAKGIEGSDKVVEAKDRAAKADQRVADANRAVQKAHEQVAKAQQAVTDAMNSGSAAHDKAAQALAKLSPAAREFVLAARDLKPLWDDLVGDPTQEALFAGSAQSLRELAEKVLPVLGAGMTAVAASMNGLNQQFAAFWAAPENLEGVRAAFAGTKSFIDGLGPGLQQATQGFLSLGQAFEPVANQVGAQFAGMLGQIGQAFTDAFQSGALTQLISNFGDTLQGLGEGLNPLIRGLIEFGNIVGPTLGPLLAQLGASLGALAPSLGQLGATFATTFTKLLPHLDRFISALAVGLEPVLPVLGDLLASLGTALTPLIGPLSQITQVVGTALAQAVTALAPAIGPLGQAFASLVTAVSPLLPVLAEVVSGLVQALAPALTTIFDALGPAIKQFADLFMPVFQELQPILAEVAQTIGTAIADALVQISPHIPAIAEAFTKLVLAITPLLPPMAELIAQVLPAMTDLLIALTPAIVGITNAFTWLINNVIVPLVIPALRGLSQFLTDQFTAAADAVRSAIAGMSAYFSDLGKNVKAAWDGIVRNVAKSVRAIGSLLQKVPAKLGPITIAGGAEANALGNSLVGWANEHMAAGGLLRGPGTGTSDSMLIAASTGEYVVNAKATAATLPLLQAINAGWVPSAEFLRSMVPGFMEGGVVAGKKFAQSMDPAKYLMGGFNRQAIDCSGMVSAVVNDALGRDPFSSRMSTVSEGQWLANLGAKPGLGPAGSINIGWYDRGGGANGHTALTLGDGTNVESRGGDGVVVGSNAAGATHKMFDKHMHIPPELLRGGDLGGPATGNGATKGGRPGKLGGGTSGGGHPGSSGGTGAGSPGASGQPSVAGATLVEVVNWPPSFGGPAATQSGTTPGTADTTMPLSETTFGPSTPAVPPNAGADSTHPLANLPLPDKLSGLFQGPAPWYLAATPEQALANLGSQAAGLAQRTGSDIVGFFQNNWKEMLNSGLAIAGMGAVGGGNTYNISGPDPRQAAAAVERVHRRLTLARQRGGGFGR